MFEGVVLDSSQEGVVEYLNVTTNQWLPICAEQWTDFNTQVVCAHLGFPP